MDTTQAKFSPVMKAFVGAIALIAVYVGFISVTNNVTRADLSKQISNKTCGALMVNSSSSIDDLCPGGMACFAGGFDRDRVREEIDGARCVTSTFVDHYCGLFESNLRLQSLPPEMGNCQPEYSPITVIQRLMNEPDLYGRIFDTNQNGPEIIKSHGLKPVKNTADS